MLETDRLVLRPVTGDDVDTFLDLVGDAEVMPWLGQEPGGRALAEELVARWAARWEANGVGPFAILLGTEVIGRTGLQVFDTRNWELSSYAAAGGHAVSELGWAVSSAHWGHGYATEAAEAVREWAFRERRLDRVISLIEPRNVRSVRVAVKLDAVPVELVWPADWGPALVWEHPR